ncbi:uncharacterized protein TNCV_442981 [Trichonephila clavipes]|nr:uncharacterized protein TNCV_442981 [Trichonephila clavipes]
MASGHSLPQINLGVQGGTQGASHIGAQQVNPEFRVGSNFRIIPEKYFSGVENVAEFLENIDNNLTYYEIHTQLACAYLKGHLTGWALDWFEVLGYRVVEDKVTDCAHLKQALTEQFPVVRNRSELEKCFYASFQKHNQKPSNFYYVEVRHPQTTSNLLQIIDKYEERFLNRRIRGSSQEFRDANQSASNHFPNRNRQENWRETRGNNRYSDNSRPQREFNIFEGQDVADNWRFDSRRRGGQSDHRLNNQGGRQDGSRNGAFRGQNGQSSSVLLDFFSNHQRKNEHSLKAERKDPEFGDIYRYLENSDDGSVNATVCEGWSQDFKLIDGLLFYAKYSTTLGELRVYIPQSLREAIMQEFHDLPLAGHLEKRKTYLKLRDACYFPYMRKYIFEYVSTCDRCQKFNYKNALPAGRLIPTVSNYPKEVVTLDLLGPYPASRP